MINAIDNWIIDRIFQKISDLLSRMRINQYTVAKFLLDGSFVSGCAASYFDIISSHGIGRLVLNYIGLLANPLLLIILRPEICRDEQAYDNGKYFLSASRPQYVILRTVCLVSSIAYFRFSIDTFSDILLDTCLYLWACRPMPPSQKTERKLDFAYNGGF